ncbi:hypothetical protein FNJ87_16180 [Nonlabens mediterrranea]|uniref:Uncharacterized protein n=1 Tax=Nonlabens mediterrranea TaxID=1419947 RepID=A0ABS0A9J4_9FLAO|nr:hypothetical protein [Nonlabens mediterrranea]
MKALLILIAVLGTGICKAQVLNDFKYVMVESQYEFQKEPNEYRLNEMMIFEIKKRGISAFMIDDVLPNDFNETSCNALSLKIETRSGLRVKMIFEFVDCNGITVFKTKEGIGRTKDFEKAYREAIRDAMTSLDEVAYKYEKPEYVKTVEGAPIDSIRTGFGRPGQENLKNEENVLSEYQQFGVVDTVSMTSKDSLYTLKFKDGKINIFKNNNLIGTLKKSTSGCYLTVTTEFIGIGYEKGNTIIIEYDKDGTQFLVFQKK